MAVADVNMLQEKPDAYTAPIRNESHYDPLRTFELPKGADKHYSQQFADMYFLRLSQLKDQVKEKAQEAWDEFEVRDIWAQGIEAVLTGTSWEVKRHISSSAYWTYGKASSAGS
jgi:DNA polymerase delta subunit 2